MPQEQHFHFAEMRHWRDICSYLVSVRESSDKTRLLEQLKQRVVGKATFDSAVLKAGIRAKVTWSSCSKCRWWARSTLHISSHSSPQGGWRPPWPAQETGGQVQVGNAITRWEWALLSTIPPQIYYTPRILGSPGQLTSIGGSNGPARNLTVCLLAMDEDLLCYCSDQIPAAQSVYSTRLGRALHLT